MSLPYTNTDIERLEEEFDLRERGYSHNWIIANHKTNKDVVLFTEPGNIDEAVKETQSDYNYVESTNKRYEHAFSLIRCHVNNDNNPKDLFAHRIEGGFIVFECPHLPIAEAIKMARNDLAGEIQWSKRAKYLLKPYLDIYPAHAELFFLLGRATIIFAFEQWNDAEKETGFTHDEYNEGLDLIRKAANNRNHEAIEYLKDPLQDKQK